MLPWPWQFILFMVYGGVLTRLWLKRNGW